MTKEEFKELVDGIVTIYGVDSYLNNIEEDMTEEEINDDLWFSCPECGEPILYDDYANELTVYQDRDGEIIYCPVCDNDIYISSYEEYEDDSEEY